MQEILDFKDRKMESDHHLQEPCLPHFSLAAAPERRDREILRATIELEHRCSCLINYVGQYGTVIEFYADLKSFLVFYSD